MNRLPDLAKINSVPLRPIKSNLRSRLNSYVYSDNAKGHTCDLTFQDFLALVAAPCTYCGETIQPRGLDRIDNSKGHLRDNVLPCCATCNVTRSNRFSSSEMTNLIDPTIRQVKIQRNFLQAKSQ